MAAGQLLVAVWAATGNPDIQVIGSWAKELAVWKGLKPNTFPETLLLSSDSASSHSSLLCLDARSWLVGSTAASLSVDTGH